MGIVRPIFGSALIFLCVAFVFIQKTNAQSLPSSADPARQNNPLKKENNFSKVEPQDAQNQKAVAPNLPPETANLKFTFKSLKVNGATAFPTSQIEALYKNLIGSEITFSQLVEIMLSLQQMYYDSGYGLSQVYIPSQDIKNGNITFQVVEGYVAEIDIDPKLLDVNLINGFKSSILSMRPLSTKKLERIMLILNDRPGLDVSSLLSTVKQKSTLGNGAVRLTLKQNDTPKNGTRHLGFDNYGSNFSGSGQITAGIDFVKNLPNYSDLALGFTQTTSAREMRQGFLSYTIPMFGVSGTTLNLSSAITFTEPGGNLDVLDIKGLSKNISGSVSYPFIRQRDKTLTLSSGFDVKDTRTDILDERLSEDRIRALFLETKYMFSDNLFGINILNAKYSQGFDILGARESGSIDLSREQGRSDFKKLDLSATRLQSITNSIDILATARGQYTSDPLLSSEEFGFGGATMGRGYDPSEIAGDKGVSFSIEARRKGTLNLSNQSLNYQIYGFYDFGKIWNIDPSSKNKISAASLGIGTRMFFSNKYQIDINLAMPLTKSVENPPKYSDKDSPRLLFSTKYDF
jgi:hemolysin activation/secretion protein